MNQVFFPSSKVNIPSSTQPSTRWFTKPPGGGDVLRFIATVLNPLQRTLLDVTGRVWHRHCPPWEALKATGDLIVLS